MADVGFVHLRVHSAFSLLEGALPIGKLIKLATADEQPALAITDTGNLFGALEFSEKATSAGLQPIIGCQLAIDCADDDAPRRQGENFPEIVILAATDTGYANLVELVSRSFLDTETGIRAHVSLDALSAKADGLIALTGGALGMLGRPMLDGREDLARSRFERLQQMFGDRLYVELQRHGTEEERRTEAAMVEMAYRDGVPLVATNEAFFPGADDFTKASVWHCNHRRILNLRMRIENIFNLLRVNF